ncbi:GtrA family protein [Metabacillus fastidiosus]|uniref:GtrA family protein n=1 Tax=Metabacillus fastidiosus TaxID=1458 RepID=UPI003D2E2816
MKFINSEFSRFVIVGGLNTMNYYVIYLICLHILNLHYFVSHAIGFVISLVGSFFLNSYFTYKVKPTFVKFLKFPLTQVANTIMSAALIFVFVDFLHVNSSLAPILTVFFTIPITFIMTGRILKPS